MSGYTSDSRGPGDAYLTAREGSWKRGNRQNISGRIELGGKADGRRKSDGKVVPRKSPNRVCRIHFFENEHEAGTAKIYLERDAKDYGFRWVVRRIMLHIRWA